MVINMHYELIFTNLKKIREENKIAQKQIADIFLRLVAEKKEERYEQCNNKSFFICLSDCYIICCPYGQ